MVCTFNKSAPPSYYRQALAYYANGTASFCFVPDFRLGVTEGDPVDFAAFENLYVGNDATGAPLNRNSGGHLSTHAPTSI